MVRTYSGINQYLTDTLTITTDCDKFADYRVRQENANYDCEFDFKELRITRDGEWIVYDCPTCPGTFIDMVEHLSRRDILYLLKDILYNGFDGEHIKKQGKNRIMQIVKFAENLDATIQKLDSVVS